MARPPIVWTDEMLEDFITSYPVMSNKDLAERFKVSLNTIRRKAKEMHLYKSPLYQSRGKTIETVKEMHGRYTAKEMAKETGVSTRTVYRICHQHNLELGKKEKSKIYSLAAKRMLDRERHKKSWGLESSTLRLIGKSKPRTDTIKELVSRGYIAIKGSASIYYSSSMTRYKELEKKAEAYGLKFLLWWEG